MNFYSKEMAPLICLEKVAENKFRNSTSAKRFIRSITENGKTGCIGFIYWSSFGVGS